MRARIFFVVSLLLGIALLLSSASPALARNREDSWEFGLFAGEAFFNTPFLFALGERGESGPLRGTRNTEFFGARLGYNFTPHWEVEFTHDDLSTRDERLVEAQRDFITDYLTLNYNFLTTTQRRLYPYLSGGVGRQVSKITILSNEEENDTTVWILGGGFRLFLNKNLSLRVDARWKTYKEEFDFDLPSEPKFAPLPFSSVFIDDDFTNLELTIGLFGIIGGKK
ncbi:MAG: outer membrane beta-barrel protein [Acidobacteriota bacterium]